MIPHALVTLVQVMPFLWLVALLPVIGLATFVALLLGYRPTPGRPVWQEGERHLDTRPARWRPAHRRTSRHHAGAHHPGWGRRHVPVRTRVGEDTVSIDPRDILPPY